jgi:hypothetical protein
MTEPESEAYRDRTGDLPACKAAPYGLGQPQNRRPRLTSNRPSATVRLWRNERRAHAASTSVNLLRPSFARLPNRGANPRPATATAAISSSPCSCRKSVAVAFWRKRDTLPGCRPARLRSTMWRARSFRGGPERQVELETHPRVGRRSRGCRFGLGVCPAGRCGGRFGRERQDRCV